jgi:hypothetical protein
MPSGNPDPYPSGLMMSAQIEGRELDLPDGELFGAGADFMNQIRP